MTGDIGYPEIIGINDRTHLPRGSKYAGRMQERGSATYNYGFKKSEKTG